MLKILLIGYGELAEAILTGILSTNHKVVGFLSWDRRKSLSRLEKFLFPDSLEVMRKRAKIPAIDVNSINSYEFIQIATTLEPDILLIASWGEILKRHAIDVPIKYTINCHPSLLPLHRGSNPYASTIVAGEKETGVTFHEVDEGIDTGRIIMQKVVPITMEDTGESIRTKCCQTARQMIPGLLDDIFYDRVELKVQKETTASYYPRLRVTDGAINWIKEAHTLHNQIRGLYPWIKSYAMYQGKIILIGKSELVNIEPSELKPGTIIKVLGNKVMVATATKGVGLLLSDLTVFGLTKMLSKLYLRRILKVKGKFKNAL